MSPFQLKLIGRLSRLLISLTVLTCRKKIIKEADLKQGFSSKIFMTWHRQIFFDLHIFKNSGISPLISQSKDGELVAAVAKAFGTDPVRGSSSKGGARALINLIRLLKSDNKGIYITADGPRGPVKKVKEGVISLAIKTGTPIVPMAWVSSREKVFEKTWDRFKIPKPFSKIVFIFGKEIMPQEYEALSREEATLFLEEKMDLLAQRAAESI